MKPELTRQEAVAYLMRYRDQKVDADLYDSDPRIGSYLDFLIPNFEFPDYCHKTLGQILKSIK
jgi:hypothetical protein